MGLTVRTRVRTLGPVTLGRDRRLAADPSPRLAGPAPVPAGVATIAPLVTVTIPRERAAVMLAWFITLARGFPSTSIAAFECDLLAGALTTALSPTDYDTRVLIDELKQSVIRWIAESAAPPAPSTPASPSRRRHGRRRDG